MGCRSDSIAISRDMGPLRTAPTPRDTPPRGSPKFVLLMLGNWILELPFVRLHCQNLGIANGGVPGMGGFQIVECAAFSSRGNLLLQGNSYLKLSRDAACSRLQGHECKRKTA